MTETQDQDEMPIPRNVHEAIRRVMIELPGIPKLAAAEHQKRSGGSGGRDSGDKGISYAYRSIEQITGDAQELFGIYGCVWVPKVISAREEERTIGTSGTRWTDVYLTVLYWVVGPGGAETIVPLIQTTLPDGSVREIPDETLWYMKGDVQLVGPLEVIGRDNADKGYNKAMTQAYKVGMLQVLCIGDPQDEGEHERHEVGSRGGRQGGAQRSDEMDQRPLHERWGYVDEDEMISTADSLKAIGDAVQPDYRQPIRDWLLEHNYYIDEEGGQKRAVPYPVRKEHVEGYRELLKAQRTASTEGAVAPPAAAAPQELPPPQEDPDGPEEVPQDLGPEEAADQPDSPDDTPPSGSPPDDIIDGIIAEVKILSAQGIGELKEALKGMGKSTAGNKEVLGRRLTMERIAAWSQENGPQA